MYSIKGIIYSDPGKYLKSGNLVGFNLNTETAQEYDLRLDDIHIDGGYVKFNEGLFSIRYSKHYSYDYYKTLIIKWRYSNDDQIALMLNKDMSEEDLSAYNMMMEWRKFASKLAKLIIKL